MKVFQIVEGICYSDITHICKTVEQTRRRYPAALEFVETPDYVFEGWGYDASAEGDARFIKPTAPEGWYYDDATGVILPIIPPETDDDIISDSEALSIIMGGEGA